MLKASAISSLCVSRLWLPGSLVSFSGFQFYGKAVLIWIMIASEIIFAGIFLDGIIIQYHECLICNYF
jgi:hypothetical protein